MKRLLTLMVATLLVLPAVMASHNSYQSYGNYDYHSSKDFEYVRYHETEDAYRNSNYNSCGYYDYDYYGYHYGSGCGRNYGDSYSYHRSRDFEFGRYSEDVSISSDYNSGYNNYRYDGYYYPSSGYYPTYSYDTDYEGGRLSGGMGMGIYGYLPYNW